MLFVATKTDVFARALTIIASAEKIVAAAATLDPEATEGILIIADCKGTPRFLAAVGTNNAQTSARASEALRALRQIATSRHAYTTRDFGSERKQTAAAVRGENSLFSFAGPSTEEMNEAIAVSLALEERDISRENLRRIIESTNNCRFMNLFSGYAPERIFAY